MRPTERTSRLLGALRQCRAVDLDKLMASGIDVTLNVYGTEESEHVGRVTLAASDCGPLLIALEAALLKSIEVRRASTARELAELTAALEKP